jgi:hypothetical protein
MSLKCLQINSDNNDIYCIFEDGVKKKNGINWVNNTSNAVKKLSDNCVITSENCSSNNLTFGCNATCGKKINLGWNSYDISWYGEWQNK